MVGLTWVLIIGLLLCTVLGALNCWAGMLEPYCCLAISLSFKACSCCCFNFSWYLSCSSFCCLISSNFCSICILINSCCSASCCFTFAMCSALIAVRLDLACLHVPILVRSVCWATIFLSVSSIAVTSLGCRAVREANRV